MPLLHRKFFPTVSDMNHFVLTKKICFSDEADNLSRNLGCRLIRTSVKEDVNVATVFRFLATKCHQLMMQQYNNVVPVGQPTISKFSVFVSIMNL